MWLLSQLCISSSSQRPLCLASRYFFITCPSFTSYQHYFLLEYCITLLTSFLSPLCTQHPDPSMLTLQLAESLVPVPTKLDGYIPELRGSGES